MDFAPQPLGSKQLVREALCGSAVQRFPAGPLAVHYCARLAGVSLRRYSTDARTLAECVVRYWERFSPDAIWLSADTWVNAEAMGAAVRFPDDDQPACGTGEPLVQQAADLERIGPPDPARHGRWPLMLEALGRIRQMIGEEAFIVACFDQYPFSLACQLLGLQRTMLLVCDDRFLVEATMQRALEYAVAYAIALARAGADMLSGGDSPAVMLGPVLYRQIALPLEQRLVAALHQAVDVPVSLHICGSTAPILADMRHCGADVYELDWQVSLPQASQVLGPDVTIWGNLDPVGLLARGTPEQVRRATSELLQTVVRCGRRRFVLSSGCTLAVDTPEENLQAMFDAARSFHI